MESIRAEIEAHGPIPFERFMELALYGEGGFFAGTTLRSTKAGDFLTSPEVSSMFGETLGAFVQSEQNRLGNPFGLIEVGAGSGTLLRPLLGVIEMEAWAVEVSPSARRALTGIPAARVVSTLTEVPSPFRGVIIANELLDNLPMAIAQLTDHGWRERWIGHGEAAFEFVDAPVRPEVGEWLEQFAGPVEVGGWVEVQLQAFTWVQDALQILTQGALVVIDYGETADNLMHRRRDGTLRTYRAHHLGAHPLDQPGATDITADVNFSALVAAAESAGAIVTLARQDDFLSEHGLRTRLSDLRRAELEAARAGEEMERLRIRTLVTEAETLLHPRGLGDFRVLVAHIA